jgi:hypothetical protein
MSLPQWTTRITDDEVGGEDHLGLEGAAQSYQQWLVPGIITTTDHARYYSFYGQRPALPDAARSAAGRSVGGACGWAADESGVVEECEDVG